MASAWVHPLMRGTSPLPLDGSPVSWSTFQRGGANTQVHWQKTQMQQVQLGEQGADFMLSDGHWRYVFALCHEVGEIERVVAV